MKNKSLIKKDKKLVLVEDKIDGTVFIDGKMLEKNKDFTVSKDGISLTDELQEKIDNRKFTSFSCSFTRSFIKKSY